MYRSPDIKTIGIYLNVPSGLLIEEAEGPAADAGLQAGDRITHINDVRVRTFGDLQYYYDKVPRDARHIALGILRDEMPRTLKVELPERWWVTDLGYRHWTVEPLVFFRTQPLSPERKSELGFPVDGFAGEVTNKEGFHKFATPPIKRGDVIYGVESVFKDTLANTPELHIKLRHRAGNALKIHVLRDEERFISELHTERQNFRKIEP